MRCWPARRSGQAGRQRASLDTQVPLCYLNYKYMDAAAIQFWRSDRGGQNRTLKWGPNFGPVCRPERKYLISEKLFGQNRFAF